MLPGRLVVGSDSRGVAAVFGPSASPEAGLLFASGRTPRLACDAGVALYGKVIGTLGISQ
jgi:hypothetical protein